ncbi:hypothetical protein ONS95_011722 [Cadophora gregata]|uniref:uncharacterized protein n=1 Tax=Cadophora gregata TaxID=51156 RepID=UPI0026DC2C08|nr:uncharacterized protein ONS95_011722 [Cadophora gregata]KAK0120316.1 hypothetical protein ONS95_011722 [Cadophora gregata]KAK0121348.1 hypothetical protein ONS96_011523 [Cadophora gregata f. sp. sojae]
MQQQNIQRKSVPEPAYLPMPGPQYTIGADGNMQYDAGATMTAQMNTTNINGGIAGNHKYQSELSGGGESDVLLRWSFIRDGSTPQYTFAMQRLGLSRQQFESDCAEIYRLNNKGGEIIDWVFCCIPCGSTLDGDKVMIDPALPEINRRMQRAGVPLAYSYTIYWQLRPVLHELTLRHVPL